MLEVAVVKGGIQGDGITYTLGGPRFLRTVWNSQVYPH